MLRALLLAGLVSAGSVLVSLPVNADQYVRGYTRRDGTYVAPHWRSSPDKSYNNNWSVSPNVNPYTGQRGTRAPTWNDDPPPRNPYNLNPPVNPYGR